MKYLTIGKIAELADVNNETIRFYERKQILPKPKRNASGYRQYSFEVVKQIKFIKKAQRLGFTLKEIDSLQSLKISPGKKCLNVKKKVDQKILEIEQKINLLNKIKAALIEMSNRCSLDNTIEKCHIIKVLEDNF